MADTINQVRNEGFKTREQLEKAIHEKATEVQNLLTENKNIEKLIEAKKKINFPFRWRSKNGVY